MKKIPFTLKPNVMITNVEGFWKEKKEKLKQKYTVITDEDVSFREGKEKEMIEILSSKLGKTNQELLSIIIAL
jgi:C4-type Zn-finger protein